MAFRGSIVVLGLVRFAIAAASAEEASEMAMIFAEMDTNKDGALSLEEFAGFSDDDGMSKEEVEDAKKEMKVSFDKLDEDKNGKLSQTEMAKELEAEPQPEEGMEEGAEADATGEVMEEGAEADATGDVMESEDMEAVATDEAEVGMAKEQNMAGDAETAARETIEDLDKDHDGQLTFGEFVAEQVDLFDYDEHEGEADKQAAKDEMMKEMKKDFERADTDGNGKLSLEEVHSIAEGDDEKSAKEIEAIYNEDEADEDDDMPHADGKPSDEA